VAGAAIAASLVNEPVEAADDRQLSKTIARCGHVDLLEIGELGYLELDRLGAEMLYQVLTGREEKNSIAVTSNEAFRGWSRTFTDPRLCAAIVDRPTSSAALSATGTKSYRLARSKANQTKQSSRPGSLRQRSHRWSQAPADKDVDLRSSHCPNVRRGGRTTTRPWAF
jgi:hypothetical protein